ncbi:glutamate--cysteine ligase GCS2 [Desulfovibrio sp. X2]|uniref:carboxylate-amine ligase n=1 Tax=Desulfovibrio sp. X2 TaxID=941449 RepID=UPI0003586DF4|nr:glutamate-cysteine ligase family protein [Desulfovibrio sp. X2]EPR39835.1 glutamate--cysteine ligase GCS2 [Desulfovibrio sp. X2]
MRLRLFEAYGVEIEYMIVDRATLDVSPVCDGALAAAAGETAAGGTGDVADVEFGDIAWSNELVLHVLEMKTDGPAAKLPGLAADFQRYVGKADAILERFGARLMPTGAHPWMDPHRETRLWPHESGPIYQAYDRIFGCRGHGWSNLQSTHLNLPFDGDEEFAALHAAIRLLLPLMPALTASTPVLDARAQPWLDARMEYYRTNSARVPSLTGLVVPEPIGDEETYRREVFERMYRDIAPLDPDGVLHDEFLNARGAIARFGRGSIEIRVLDSQECPAADLACAGLICAALRRLCSGRWSGPAEQFAPDTQRLHALLLAAVRDADRAVVADEEVLRLLRFPGKKARAGEVWAHLAETCLPEEERDPAWAEPLGVLLGQGPEGSGQGCLARRIREALGPDFDRSGLSRVYGELCDCLAQGRVFRG